jgi:hypothetical protein
MVGTGRNNSACASGKNCSSFGVLVGQKLVKLTPRIGCFESQSLSFEHPGSHCPANPGNDRFSLFY